MKFAKQLEKSAVVEWRSQYFDYRKGKKLIKRIERERDDDPSVQASVPREEVPLVRPGSGDTGTPSPSTPTTSPATQVLEGFLKSELSRVDEFYCLKESEAIHRLAQIKAQLREMRVLEESAKGLATRRAAEASQPQLTRPEVAMLPLIWRRLRENVRSAVEFADSDLLERHPLRDSAPDASAIQLQINYRLVRRRLRAAIKEYYHSLELLGSYQVLNQTALSKCLKKAEKATGLRLKRRYLEWYQRNTTMGQSETIEHLLKETEDVYSQGFFDNRKRALASLRMHVRTEDSRFTMLRVGGLLGLSIPMLLEGIVKSQISNKLVMSPSTRIALLQVFAGYFLVLLAAHLFGVSCYFWERSRISYVFVFELDTNHNLSWPQYFEIPAILTFLFALSFWMCFSEFFPGAEQYYPLALLAAGAIFLLTPLNIAHRSSRRWLIVAVARLILPGVVSVRFQDVFLGDILNSLTYSVGNVPFFFCLYARDWVNPVVCGSSRSRLFGFFQTVPGIIRLLHCMRRYQDTRHTFPHIYNAAKYTATILQYAFLSVWRIDSSARNRALFATFASINTVATVSWDVLMDTSLLQRSKKHPLLRDYLAFNTPWPYWVFLVLDPILRCSWIFYIIYEKNRAQGAAVSFYIALAEVIRRSMWASLRVENEHCANVLTYRATRELPLPFAIDMLGDTPPPQPGSDGSAKAPTIAQAHATDFSRRRPNSLRSMAMGSTADSDDDDEDD